jgi:hypothetical protein
MGATMDQSSLDRLSNEQFRRLTGLKRPMFQKMIQVLHWSTYDLITSKIEHAENRLRAACNQKFAGLVGL